MQWVPGFCPVVKRSECDISHSPPSSVEVKNEWTNTSTSLICFLGVYTDNITFTIYHSSVCHITIAHINLQCLQHSWQPCASQKVSLLKPTAGQNSERQLGSLRHTLCLETQNKNDNCVKISNCLTSFLWMVHLPNNIFGKCTIHKNAVKQFEILTQLSFLF